MRKFLLGLLLALWLASPASANVVCSSSPNSCQTFFGGLLTSPLLLPDGTAGAPSLSFANDTNTGIYRITGDTMGLVTGGLARYQVGTTGFKLAANMTLGWSATNDDATAALDTILVRDAANTLAQRNSTTAQTFRVYNTFTDASNYERTVLDWNTNILSLGTQNAGTGNFRATRLYGSQVSIFTHATASSSATTKFDVTATDVSLKNIGTGTASANVGGVLNVNTTSQATTGTVEEILATYTLPANTLSANGKGVRITAHGTLAANGNTKVVRIRFGGIGGTTVTARSTVGNGVAWEATAIIIRTGAATQVAIGRAFSSLDNVQLSDSAPTQTLSGTVDIVVTGTTATAIGDLTFKSLIVETLN